MFDLDMSKILLVTVVALIVVGPKELPQVLRALGRAVSRARTLQSSVQKVAADFMAEADVDGLGKELSTLEHGVRTSIGSNPATAMRGSLPARSGAPATARVLKVEAPHYLSPEMEAYLSPAPESLPDDPRILSRGGRPVAVQHAATPTP